MTRLVDRMLEAGLVDRRACATDRRVTYAALTDAGRATLARALPVHDAAVERLFSSHLSAAQRDQMQAALTKVLTANGQAVDVSCDPAEAEDVRAG
jgi:DNA-binding MarR family transcriptional regulator